MNYYSSIGGFFEMELNDFGDVYHNDLYYLNSGRNALKFILSKKKYKKIYIPYYICEKVLQPLVQLGIKYEFYFLDKFFHPLNVSLNNQEAILFVNYFGIMNPNVESIVNNYKNVIVDNSQAFFEYPIDGTEAFYSPRKFFGLPDGGFAYCENNGYDKLDFDVSHKRLDHLTMSKELQKENTFDLFKKNELVFDKLQMKKMSKLTYELMKNINYKEIIEKRNKNFHFLHKFFGKYNELSEIIVNNKFICPMFYPFLRKGNSVIKDLYIKNYVYLPTYWENIQQWLNGENRFENYIFENLISFPIDQRYGKKEMQKIINLYKQT